MNAQLYLIDTVLSVILIVGAYQFYFFTQRHPRFESRTFQSRIDEKIPFWPAWVWIYSCLYYPAIIYLNFLARDTHHFVLMAFSFTLLLFMQMAVFYLFPVATPPHWRQCMDRDESPSVRFLRFVQKFDAPSNCFPSMHVSVAMLTALHALPELGPGALLFPALIGVSCLFTKQHYLIDLPFGALLGWVAHQAYLRVA